MIERKVTKGSKEAEKLKNRDNLDLLLEMFKPGKEISTLTKSQHDWEKDKQEVGDADELARFAKSSKSHVEKQSFLARAEQREAEAHRKKRMEGKRYAANTVALI